MGDGPPLIHLPGFPFSNLAGEWRIPAAREAFERLARDVRLIQYDGRGTGHSQRDVTDFSLDAMLGDLDAVVGAAGLAAAQVSLLGFYASVPTAIAYAARHWDRVSHLVLFGGSAVGQSPMSGPETQALLSLIERDWNVFVESTAHAWLGWNVDPEAGRLAADWFRTATTPATARATLEAAGRVDVTDLLPRVRCPVLVLHRQDARVIPIETSEGLAAALPNARLEILPGSSESLFFEEAPYVERLLVEFVTGHPPSGGSQRAGPDAPAPGAEAPRLSPRELDVLRLIAAGDSNAEIADRLGVTINTIERHAANLYRKIDARGRADAAAFAVRHGLG